MSEKKLVSICCPAKGGLPWYWIKPMIELTTMNHPKFAFNVLIESGHHGIGIARNILADSIIEDPQKIWKMVTIDSDAFWTAKQLLQLIDHEEPFVAGPYVKKTGGPVSWLMVRTPGVEIRSDNMMECDFMGPHFMAMEVEALRKVRDANPERWFTIDEKDGEFKNRKVCELFPIGLVGPNTPEGRLRRIKVSMAKWLMSGNDSSIGTLQEIDDILSHEHPGETRLLGEDYHFCILARKAGFKLYCDLNTNPVGHVGDIVYPVGPDQNSVATPFPFSHDSMKHLIDYV